MSWRRRVLWSVTTEGWAYFWVPSRRAWLPVEEARATGKKFKSHVLINTAKQASRVAGRCPDPYCVRVVKHVRVFTRKHPNGHEKTYALKRGASR